MIYRKVVDVFIKEAEYMDMPVHCSDDDLPLQKIFMAVPTPE